MKVYLISSNNMDTRVASTFKRAKEIKSIMEYDLGMQGYMNTSAYIKSVEVE